MSYTKNQEVRPKSEAQSHMLDPPKRRTMWFTPEGAKMADLTAFKATWRSIKSQDPKSEQVPSGGQNNCHRAFVYKDRRFYKGWKR